MKLARTILVSTATMLLTGPLSSAVLAQSAANEYLDRAAAYEKRGQFALAEKDFTKAIKAAPTEFAPYLDRAKFYERRNNAQKALADLNTAGKMSSNDRSVLMERIALNRRLGKFEAALADCNRAIQLDNTKSDGYLQRGETYYQLKQYDKAIADATKLITAHSNFGAARLLRAEAYIAQKNIDKAVPDLDAAISANSKDAGAYAVRFKIRRDKKDLTGAREDLNKLLVLNSDNVGMYKERLKIDKELKDNGGIISDLAKISALEPSNTAMKWQYAQMVWDKEPIYALKTLDGMIGKKSENADYYGLRALVYNELEKFDKGTADANTALAINPKLPSALRARGEAALYNHEFEKALADFESASAVDQNPLLLFYKGRALEGLHKDSLALQSFEQFVTKMTPEVAQTKEDNRHIEQAKNKIDRLKSQQNESASAH